MQFARGQIYCIGFLLKTIYEIGSVSKQISMGVFNLRGFRHSYWRQACIVIGISGTLVSPLAAAEPKLTHCAHAAIQTGETCWLTACRHWYWRDCPRWHVPPLAPAEHVGDGIACGFAVFQSEKRWVGLQGVAVCSLKKMGRGRLRVCRKRCMWTLKIWTLGKFSTIKEMLEPYLRLHFSLLSFCFFLSVSLCFAVCFLLCAPWFKFGAWLPFLQVCALTLTW